MILKQQRKQLIIFLFEISQKLYTSMFKSDQPWGISVKDLLTYPKMSFGFHLGKFLSNNNFELIPKVERHDCYHLLTGYGTEVEDEVALQWLCYGNGKRSLYLYGSILLGTVILPDYYKYYFDSFNLGKRANAFYDLDYQKLLKVNFNDLRLMIFNKVSLLKLNLK